MELPALTPKEFAFLQSAATDLELYNFLVKNTDQFVHFFILATEDETWSEIHDIFMSQALTWFTNQFFLRRFDESYAKEIASAFYEHYPILQSFLPKNIKIKIQSQIIPMNSLLLGVQSPYLNNLIQREIREKRKKTVLLPAVDEKNIPFIVDYLQKFQINDLWKLEQKEILRLLEIAIKLHLDPLTEECQNILKRYLTFENVIETILLAHQKQWLILKEESIDYFNRLHWGITIQSIDQDHLGFEFLLFSERTWDIFDKFKLWITHLIASKTLPAEERFATAITECPKLISINVSNSEVMSPYLDLVPSKVKELVIARCIWLNDKTFKIIVPFFSQITKLDVTQNSDISYVGWGELKKLPELKSLVLDHCHQICDEELSIIVQACLSLREIDLTNCRNITSSGFINLAQALIRLTVLRISRTAISDAGLVELANRAHFIEIADFSKCLDLTEKGIHYFLKYEGNLKILNLTGIRLSKDVFQMLEKSFPKVKFIS